MTPDELKTTREAVGLSVSQLAELAQVQERTVRYWETGHSAVPQDVAKLITQIDSDLNAAVQHALSDVQAAIASAGSLPEEIVLLRYREDADLWHYRADMKGLPVTTHAATLHRLRGRLANLHVASRIVYLNRADYEAWLGKREDGESFRAAWAALQVPEAS